MSGNRRRKVVVLVGAGFSAALTAGSTPMIARAALPTLDGFAERLFEFSKQLTAKGLRAELPFSDRVLEAAISVLSDNASRPPAERYDFEQLMSLVAIRQAIAAPALLELLNSVPLGSDPSVLRCLVGLVACFVSDCVGLDPTVRANRNYWIAVNDALRVRALKRGVRRVATDFEATFVSFNYDGFLEASLDWFHKDEGLLLFVPEVSHGIPMVMPENVYGGEEYRARMKAKYPQITTVLKPHGSMHFFRVRAEIERLYGGSQIVALHPRFDVGFDPATMQRDIPRDLFWQFADSVPFLIPPLLNKDGHIGSDYFREVLRMMVQALSAADAVVCVGFSLPKSDLHVCAGLELVDWKRKRVGLCYRSAPGDGTLSNWRRVLSFDPVVLADAGMPTDNESHVEEFWTDVAEFLSS